MRESQTGQLTGSAAEVYEKFFVPALFADWAARVSDAAGITAGDRVLDVACGTGVLAREVQSRIQPGGSVVGADRNEGMLDVARNIDPDVDWQLAMAEELPFTDASFDAVVSQFGLMFFENQSKSLGEMWRVLRPGGRLAVAVWDSLDNTPGYAAMAGLLNDLFGAEAAQSLHAPYNLGNTNELAAVFDNAGISGANITTMDGFARFSSIADWVHTDVNGWTLAGQLDDEQYDALQKQAEVKLQAFTKPDGSVEFASPAHIVTAQKA